MILSFPGSSRPAAGAGVRPPLVIAAGAAGLDGRPARHLVQALHALGERDSARVLFLTCPPLKRLSLRLAGHLTMALPGAAEPLLVETLRLAFAAQRDASNLSPNGRIPAAHFIERVGLAAPLLLARTVRHDLPGQAPAWEALTEPLHAYAARAPGCGLRVEHEASVSESEREAAPEFLLMRLMSRADYGLYKIFLRERLAAPPSVNA